MKVQSSPDVVAERIKKVVALKARGMNITEICKEMGLPKSTVNYYMYHDLYQKHNKRPKAKRGVVSVLGSKVNGRNEDKVSSLLAQVLRLLPDDKLVEMVEAAHE